MLCKSGSNFRFNTVYLPTQGSHQLYLIVKWVGINVFSLKGSTCSQKHVKPGSWMAWTHLNTRQSPGNTCHFTLTSLLTLAQRKGWVQPQHLLLGKLQPIGTSRWRAQPNWKRATDDSPPVTPLPAHEGLCSSWLAVMCLCMLWFRLFIETSDSGPEFLKPVVKLLHLDSCDINYYSSMDGAGEVGLCEFIYLQRCYRWLNLVMP